MKMRAILAGLMGAAALGATPSPASVIEESGPAWHPGQPNYYRRRRAVTAAEAKRRARRARNQLRARGQHRKAVR